MFRFVRHFGSLMCVDLQMDNAKIIFSRMKFLFFFVFFIITNAIAAKHDTFKVALPILMPFNPISNETSSANYISHHLYYPLFNLDDSGNTVSPFLDMNESKSLSLEFNTYRLCIKKDIRFSDNSQIISDDLLESLNYLTKIAPHVIDISKIIKETSQCLQIKLKRPTPNLFKKLTGTSSTILKKEDVTKTYPIGLGAYKIKNQTVDRMSLIYIGTTSPRFKEIEFIKIKSPQDVGTEMIHDFNQMPNADDFNYKESSTNKYSVPSLKVYSLVINLLDMQERRCVQQLLSFGKWDATYTLPVIQQDSFLPWRSKREVIRPIKTKCQQSKQNFPFLVVDIYDPRNITKELVRIGADKKLDVVALPSKDFAEWIFSGKQYVSLIGFDSTSTTASLDGDFSYYFESFFVKENRIVTKPIPGLEKIIKQATRFNISPQERLDKTIEAENLLIKDGWVLPIGRLDRKLIFPSDINIIEWADKLNGIPAVWKIQN